MGMTLPKTLMTGKIRKLASCQGNIEKDLSLHLHVGIFNTTGNSPDSNNKPESAAGATSSVSVNGSIHFSKGFQEKKIDFLRKKCEKCILVNFSKMEEATIRTCTLQTGSQDCESGLFEYPVLFPRIKNMCQLMHTVVFFGRTGGGGSQRRKETGNMN